MGEGISEGSKGEKRCEKPGVKIYEAPEVLPTLQANRLAGHSFMDAARRQETPGSETKVFIVASHLVVGISCFHRFASLTPTPSLHRAGMEGPRVICSLSQLKTLELRESRFL